ncbi:MAG: DUF3604 domain-containing protein [Candidatus Brocadiia bacterium]
MGSYRSRFARFGPKFDAESHFLHLIAPSVVRPGESFALRAVMMDAAGMPAEDWTGRAALRPSGEALRTPAVLEFTPRARGAVCLEGLVAEEPGGYFIEAEPEGCPGRSPRSNAIQARTHGPRLFWGDIHAHTTVSNCHADLCKDPEFGYWYGRDVALLDFCAAADHLRGIHRREGNWQIIKDAAREHHAPGEFVTFLAFESSHASGCGGDNNVYYNADDADHFWVDREDMKGTQPKVTLRELWDWLDARGVPYITVPHHTARAAKYRDFAEDGFYNPARETVLEVFSWWGSSESRHDDLFLKGGKADCRAHWTDALELGYRYGVIGSSDTHHTMPGTPYPVNAENYGYAQMRLNCQGLAAVYADELERNALFGALEQRRCYATTFWRPVIEFEVSGAEMGREVRADEGLRNARHARAEVATPDGATLTLLRNNQPIARQRLDAGLASFSFTDEQPLEPLCLDDKAGDGPPFVFYFLKLEPRSGQVAWSSPVWVTM